MYMFCIRSNEPILSGIKELYRFRAVSMYVFYIRSNEPILSGIKEL